MQALGDRSTTTHRRRFTSPWLALLAVALVVGGGAAVYAVTRGAPAALSCSGASCTTGSGAGGRGSGGATGGGGKGSGGATSRSGRRDAHIFTVSSTTPAAGATGIPSNAKLAVTFDSALEPGGPTPTLSPAMPGTWQQASNDELVFSPSAPFVPYQTYTLTIPGGRSGPASVSGSHLAATKTVSFTIAAGSTLRLQQLLAELGYLPLSYSGGTPAPQDMATPQPGTLTWRWSGLPSELTGQWTPGAQNAITKGAVEMFETENGLPVDGISGPKVWTALLHDAVSHKANAEPVTYVLVTKVLPEHLTAWVNGTLQFKGIPVNTGVPGANTTDGTFQVFEHVPFSDMRGTDVTGTKYTDPHVPWASYFNGGDALHGYPRATYGWPQSNGCVEMPISTAGKLWPYTPIGTLVTVIGPSSGGTTPATPPQTTTTTTARPTTTTTRPPTTTTARPTTTTRPPTTTTARPTTTTTRPPTTTTTTTRPPTTTTTRPPTTTTRPPPTTTTARPTTTTTTAPTTTTTTTTAPTTTTTTGAATTTGSSTTTTTTKSATVREPSSQTPSRSSTG